MRFGELLQKHGKIEQYEKKNEPTGKYYSVSTQQEKNKGLEDLQLIDISRPSKKERTVCKPVTRPYIIIQLKDKR